jgi:hypothetical protein
MAITRLALAKPVTRETDVFERVDPLVVTLRPRHLEIRIKGSKESYTIGYAKLLSYARGLASAVKTKAARY